MARVRKIPQRMCLGCQEMKNKKELVRVVRTPEGEILIDPTGKKSGRGAYICPSADCLNQAIKGKRLEKALSHSVSQEILESLKEKVVT
ncbi:MAG: YlxR family protein [Syntrophomonadaceae bacterium]|nr:YlxR family protein [Syntrophomonadaceae bacterium]